MDYPIASVTADICSSRLSYPWVRLPGRVSSACHLHGGVLVQLYGQHDDPKAESPMVGKDLLDHLGQCICSSFEIFAI